MAPPRHLLLLQSAALAAVARLRPLFVRHFRAVFTQLAYVLAITLDAGVDDLTSGPVFREFMRHLMGVPAHHVVMRADWADEARSAGQHVLVGQAVVAAFAGEPVEVRPGLAGVGDLRCGHVVSVAFAEAHGVRIFLHLRQVTTFDTDPLVGPVLLADPGDGVFRREPDRAAHAVFLTAFPAVLGQLCDTGAGGQTSLLQRRRLDGRRSLPLVRLFEQVVLPLAAAAIADKSAGQSHHHLGAASREARRLGGMLLLDAALAALHVRVAAGQKRTVAETNAQRAQDNDTVVVAGHFEHFVETGDERQRALSMTAVADAFVAAGEDESVTTRGCGLAVELVVGEVHLDAPGIHRLENADALRVDCEPGIAPERSDWNVLLLGHVFTRSFQELMHQLELADAVPNTKLCEVRHH